MALFEHKFCVICLRGNGARQNRVREMPNQAAVSSDELAKTTVDSREREEHRINLRLSPEAKEALDIIANDRHSSYSEVIRRALGTEQFMWNVKKKNGRIIIDIPGEGIKEIVLSL